jgi:large subunit ribosomal protein L1
MKRSKKYVAAVKKIDRKKKYSIEEAVKLMPEVSTSKFAGTVSLAVMLNLNDKQKKESIRGSYTLPNRFGAEIKVLLFADSSYKKVGTKADIVGGEELIKEVEAGKLKFDVVIAMPMMMAKIAKLGKVLGSKGLMPNPKNGTVAADPDAAIDRVKSGMTNFKMDDAGRIIMSVGKTDMKAEKLTENVNEAIKVITAETKKLGVNMIGRTTLTPSMGPSVLLTV